MQENTQTAEFKPVKSTRRRGRARRQSYSRGESISRIRFFPAVSRRFARNTFICAVILLALVGLKNIDSELTREFVSGISQAVNSEVELTTEYGELELVSTDNTTAVSVPLDGEIATVFSDTGCHIVMTGESDSDVAAMVSGEVTAATDNSVTIYQSDGAITSYFGLQPNVKVGDTVENGQSIGVLKSSELTLSTQNTEGYIDPMSLLTSGGN